MELQVRQAFGANMKNLQNRICSARFLTFFLMLILFMDMYLSGFRDDVRFMGESCGMAVLPFLQTSDYFMKLVLLSAVYFYSNVPFVEKEELFFLIRLGRQRWGRRNLWYLAGSAMLLTLCLLIISWIQILPVSRVSLSWDGVYKTLALTGGRYTRFGVPYGILQEFSPAELMGFTLCIDWLALLFLGLLMYVISLSGYRILACAAAAIMVFLPMLDARIGGTLLYYSPLSWMDCANWRVGFDNTKPDIPYMLVALLSLNLLLLLAGQYQARRMEWNMKNEG
ncbi:MAG: hypothetical protein Q4C82_07335 [Eubacteriales bacterium]|nr:hypothetical protein [Eubacteriales bacterium]